MAFELKRHGLDQRIIDILEDKKIKSLRKIQSQALREGVLEGVKLLIVAPSAMGKTFIGEIAAVHTILKRKMKSVFLVPLRAIANEKFQEFHSLYNKLGIKVVVRTGDFDLDLTELATADFIISTYERFDSLLRRSPKDRPEWLETIGTIVIDEIHIINDYNRGPRLEGLLTRLKRFLPEVQLIGLSATVSNPEELALWLDCKLIKADYRDRPIELKLFIFYTADKIHTISKLVIKMLKAKGQVLIFTKTRKEAQKLASDLVRVVIDNKLLGADERVKLNNVFKEQELTSKAKLDRSLINTMKFGVAYHHAGLALDTRKLIEENFRHHLIKIIACTTTLAAGVNLPAKCVIIKDCQVITTDPNLLTCDDSYYWRNQLDQNLLHQILGRAGRPGYDSIGIGVVLASTKVDANRIAQYYFKNDGNKVRPKYGKVVSQLNQREMLYEQVLVMLVEKGELRSEEILEAFKDTYWYCRVYNETPDKPIDQLIEIGAVSIEKTVTELTSPEVREKASRIPDSAVELTQVENKILQGIISDTITHTCALYQDFPSCTCREFKYRETSHQISLCRHLVKLIEVGMKRYPRITNDLACLALQREFILDSLIKMGMVTPRGNKYIPTRLGMITAKNYIKPSSAIVIKARLPKMTGRADILETISKLHVIEMNKYANPMFVQILVELVERSDSEPLKSKILEISFKYFKGQGDIEEYISFTRWMANTIAKLADLFGFPTVKNEALFIQKKLEENSEIS